MSLTIIVLVVHSMLQVVDRRAAAEPPSQPLKIEALQDSGFNFEGFFSMTIDAGKGLVEIDGRTRRLGQIETKRLERAVQAARFWDLAPGYGYVCWDCGSCTIVVEQGGRRHQVVVNRYANPPLSKKQREEVNRALRVWDALKNVGGITNRGDACR